MIKSLRMVSLICVLALPLAAQSPPVRVSSGRIAGVVRRAGTGQPVPGATVKLSPWAVSGPSTVVRTDNSGRFVFTEVPTNAALRVSRFGYVSEEDICPRPEPGCSVVFPAGAVVNDIVVDLVPTGAVSGVVRASGGSPLPLITVHLLSVSYDSTGKKAVQEVESTRTDDRGAYRFHGVHPGRYYVEAGRDPEWGEPNGVQPYRRQYYPEAESVGRASAVEVAPGADLNSMDFSLQRATPFRVRGHAVDARTGKAPSQVRIAVVGFGESVSVFEPNLFEGDSGNALGSGAYSNRDGAFEIGGLLPGRYVFVVTPQGRGAGASPAGYATVEVTDRDVDAVRVFLTSGGSLSGRVVVEGQESSTRLSVKPPAIQLTPVINGVPVEAPNVPAASLSDQANASNPGSPRYKEDGTFRFDNLRPGVYRLQVSTKGTYVKEARLGGVDIAAEDFTIEGNSPGPVTIVLSSDMAVVSGHVSSVVERPKDAIKDPVVVLVPDRPHPQPDRLRWGTADEDGSFRIPDVPPGDYRAFAAVTEDSGALFNPEFRERFAANGVPVHVTPGPNPPLTVGLIPTVQP